MASNNNLSLLQIIDIPFGVIQAVIGTIFTAAAAPFRGANTPATLNRHLRLSITRKVLTRLSPEQLQSIAGTTESNYIAWAKSQNVTPREIHIPDVDTKVFWIGDENAENLVIFYHGGGWAMPASGHFILVQNLVSEATKAGKSVAVLLLQYDLAPRAVYPRQHTQAVELLRYATTELRKSPDRITLMGDSSGGNLIFGVLSHLMHPHPSIKPLKLSRPLRLALISSPVTVLNTKAEGFRTQEEQDPASAETIRTWMSNMLGTSPPDSWSQPLTNDAKWWEGLASIVREVLVTVAAKEMMAEDTRACAEKMKTVSKNVTLFASEVDFHAQCSIGPSLGMEQGEAADLMISWVIERS